MRLIAGSRMTLVAGRVSVTNVMSTAEANGRVWRQHARRLEAAQRLRFERARARKEKR